MKILEARKDLAVLINECYYCHRKDFKPVITFIIDEPICTECGCHEEMWRHDKSITNCPSCGGRIARLSRISGCRILRPVWADGEVWYGDAGMARKLRIDQILTMDFQDRSVLVAENCDEEVPA